MKTNNPKPEGYNMNEHTPGRSKVYDSKKRPKFQGLQFIRLFTADQRHRATILNATERGLFVDLLMAYIERGRALPYKWTVLYRMANASTDWERKCVRGLMPKCFKLVNQEWVSEEAEQEIANIAKTRCKAKTHSPPMEDGEEDTQPIPEWMSAMKAKAQDIDQWRASHSSDSLGSDSSWKPVAS